MKDSFSSKLRELRRESAMSQEQLANICGVSVQAVSKWECAQSYPDIELLEIIADTFGVTIDALLRENAQADGARAAAVTPCDESESESDDMPSDIPDDGVLRVVQYCGRRLLRADDIGELTRELHLDGSVFRIPLLAADSEGVNDGGKTEIKVEIWGDADIVFAHDENVLLGVKAGGDITVREGDLNGPADVGGNLSCCGDINGPASAGGDLQLGGSANGPTTAGGDLSVGDDVSGAVSAGGDLTVGGDVSGDAAAGGGIFIKGDVSGNVTASEDVTVQGDVTGDLTADGNISCGNAFGDVHAGGGVSCGNVEGDVETGLDVECGDVEGDVKAYGDVHCGDVEGDVEAGGKFNAGGDVKIG